MNIRPVSRIDWFRVLHDLQEHGLSVSAVAKQIDVAKSTVLGWKQDAEPRHGDGELLLALWAHVTRRDRAMVPRVAAMVARPATINEAAFVASRAPSTEVNHRPVLTADGWVLPDQPARARA